MTTTEREQKASFELDQVLAQLTPDQIRFVVARQEHNTDKDAAEAISIRPNLVSRWKHLGVPIDEAVKAMALDGLVTALHVRKRSLAKAMLVKVAGLDSESEATRQKASTEIIEWEMGRAVQRSEHTGPEGGPIETKTAVRVDVSELSDNDIDALAAIARRIAGDTQGASTP